VLINIWDLAEVEGGAYKIILYADYKM